MRSRVLAGLVIALAGLAVLYVVSSSQSGGVAPAASPSPTSVQPRAGEEGRLLSTIGASYVFLAADALGLDEYRNALAAPDNRSDAFVTSGRISRITAGARVLVLNEDVHITQVRILDGPIAGQVGWVYREAVSRLP